MKAILLGVLVVGVFGCSRAQPTMAGGKPVSYWVAAVHDPDPQIRKKAVFKLGNVGPTDPAALAAVTEGLKDNDPGVRRAAVLAILKFGRDAKGAVPTLTHMRDHDADAQVRSDAAKALDKLQ
jgi:HEAT repeat protein